MTRMLAAVADADDARVAADAGVDLVEVRMRPPPAGAAFDPAPIRAVRAAFPGLLRVRIEDPEGQPGAVEAALSFGADEIALPAAALAEAAAVLQAAAPLARPVALVALVLAADHPPAPPAAGSAQAVLLDARDGRLIDRLSAPGLDAFAEGCRAAALPLGFAGGLEAPDVARLLLLNPDLLAFDTALRRNHRPDAPLDAAQVAAIRALIPSAKAGSAPPLPDTGETDVVFVHDFVAMLSIGAYQAERGMRQRVRFSVDADVRRARTAPTDMAGVFSYDIIIETVRVLAARAHVTFVETLAEELAVALLAHAQVSAVTVKVEKLDVIEGAVGVLVRRDRAKAGSP